MPRPVTQLVARYAPLAVRQLSPHVAHTSFLTARSIKPQFHARGFRIWSILSWDEDEYWKGFDRGFHAGRGNQSWSSSMTSGYMSGFRMAQKLDRKEAKTGRGEWITEIVDMAIWPIWTVVAAVGGGLLADRYWRREPEES